MEEKMLISEVAKRYNISRPSLIYYDRIGLLSPYHDPSTGYRYYSFKDMEKLEMILILKESGLSLKGIKGFMEDPSHRECILLLKKQRDVIKGKIREFERLEATLNNHINIFEEYERVELYKGIQVKHYESHSFLAESLDYSLDAPMEEAVKTLRGRTEFMPWYSESAVNKFGFILSETALKSSDYQRYSHVIDYMTPVKETSRVMISPEGDYICTLHNGALERIGDTLKKAVEYMVSHGYSLEGDCYIIPLVDSWGSAYEDKYVSEILIPVKRKGS